MTRRRLMGRPAGGRITGDGQTVFNSSASLRRTTLWLPHHAREVKFLSVASSRLDSGFCDHSFAGADGSLMVRSCPSKKLPDYAVFDKSVDRKSPTFTPPQSHLVIEACKPLLFIDFALVPGGGFSRTPFHRSSVSARCNVLRHLRLINLKQDPI
jgi:hypothetical protein